MKVKLLLKAVGIKMKQSRSFGKRMSKSYFSLFLVFILAISSTLAWFVQHQTAELTSGVLEFQSASSLRINKDNTSANRILIEDAVLDEASSVDGRNLFFPVGESFNNTTAEMFFRDANKGDQNVHYIYKDFHLKGSSGPTAVYIKSYQITISTYNSTTGTTSVTSDGYDAVYHDELTINYDANGKPVSQTLPRDNCPIRIAFISDSAQTPVVIDPSAQVDKYVDDCDAVSLIDDDGSPFEILRTRADSFSSYYYGRSPLFTIPGGQDLPVALVVWLEATAGNCDEYMGKRITIDIDIESNFSDMEKITFVDDVWGDSGSGDHWISNPELPENITPIFACSYVDPNSDPNDPRTKTVIMEHESTYEWTAYIPKKAVTDISFYRLTVKNNTTQGTIYNSWHTCEGVNGMLGSGINNAWFDSNFPVPEGSTSPKNLQESRQRIDQDGNKVNETVYTATHGNGFGSTTVTSERLSPCIGYWGHVTSGVSGNSGSESGNTGGGGGAGDASTTYTINLAVNVAQQTWIYSNVNDSASGSSFWFSTENGQQYQMNKAGSNRFEWSGSLDEGDKITTFYINSSAGVSYRTWPASPPFEVVANWNVTYEVNRDNNKMIKQ